MGGSVNAPYPQHPGAGSRGYEDEYNEPQAPPTDFDALFSGKSRPSIAVSQIMFLSPTIRREYYTDFQILGCRLSSLAD